MITVINLCYNTGKLVIDTLKSINDQTYKDFEVIIIDDASADDSVTVVEGWLKDNATFKYQFLKNEVNKGISKSLNFGLQHASGEYIAIIGDDMWEPEFFEKSIAAFQIAPPTVALVSSKAVSLDLRSNSSKIIDNFCSSKKRYPRFQELYKQIDTQLYFMESDVLNDCMFWMNPIIAFTVLIDKNKLTSVGGFCESYSFEDYPTWFMMSKKYDFAYIDVVLGKYIVHGQNFSLKKESSIFLNIIKMLIDNYSYLNYKDSKECVNKRISILSYNVFNKGNLSIRRQLMYLIMRFSRYNFIVSLKLSIGFLRRYQHTVLKKISNEIQLK